MAADSLASLSKVAGRSFIEFKKLFFDRAKVEGKAKAGKLKALARYGAILRRAAQTSMRYRKGPSKPGEPPSAHKSKRLAGLKKLGRSRHNGALLREMLFYAYDPASGTVVVGPVGFRSRSGPVPALHEFGGTKNADGETMTVKNKPGRDITGRFVSKGDRVIRLKGAVRYPKRPTMGPALKRTVTKYPEQFRGVVS